MSVSVSTPSSSSTLQSSSVTVQSAAARQGQARVSSSTMTFYAAPSGACNNNRSTNNTTSVNSTSAVPNVMAPRSGGGGRTAISSTSSSGNSSSKEMNQSQAPLYTYCGTRSLDQELIALPAPEKFKCIRNFWAARQDTPYFCLRHTRELPTNASIGMDRIFNGSVPKLKLNVQVETVKSCGKDTFICGYWWPGLDKHIKACGCTREIAIRNAAIEALKAFMSENEFNLVCLFTSNKIYEGMTAQQTRALLFFDESNPTPKPAAPRIQAYSQPIKNPYLELTREKYLRLPQNAKEATLLSFWGPYFYNPSSKFPRIHRLFNVVGIERNAILAFAKLFSKQELSQRCTGIDTKELRIITEEEVLNGTSKFVTRLRWTVGGREYVKEAEGKTTDEAENLAAIAALVETLGQPHYELLVHLSQPFFYTGVDICRVQNNLKMHPDLKTSEAEDSPQPAKKARIDSGSRSSIVALEELVATKGLPLPKYKYSDAYAVRCTVRDHIFEAVYRSEADAKNIAAFQALEFLWGGKLPI